MAVVATDMMDPEEDPVRAGGVDDPLGGPLDGASEAWRLRLVAAGEVQGPSLPPAGSVVYGPVETIVDTPAPRPRRAFGDDEPTEGA
jgi:hypothetical protein